MTVSAAREANFQELHRRVRAAGLLEAQPRFHTIQFVRAVGLVILGWVLVSWIRGVVSFGLAAFVLAVAYVQTGMVMHDACHRALLPSRRASDFLRLFCGNLCIGISCGWWTYEHNRHHVYANRQGLDPDIAVPHLAFTDGQAAAKPAAFKLFVRWQAWLFFPMLVAQCVYLRAGSYMHLARCPRRPRVYVEMTLIAAHWVAYFSLVIGLLGPGLGALFVLAHQAAFGFYGGMVFGAGHKGMPMLDANPNLGFVERQVMTTRDLEANWFTNLWYRGLHYQIEHHLFPAMSRNRFKEAQVIVKTFCRDNGIPFEVTDLFTSYRQILTQLAATSATSRSPNVSGGRRDITLVSSSGGTSPAGRPGV